METFAPGTKIWIYQAERDLTDQELVYTHDYLTAFCKEWTAHNQQLHAGADILYKRFIVLKVDESHTNASGCSIDKSVKALKELSAGLGINLFDRMQLPYYENDQIKTVDYNHVEEALERSEISASTPFFDLNLSKLEQLKDRFMVPLREHWAYPKV
jgi:hypothetical protein